MVQKRNTVAILFLFIVICLSCLSSCDNYPQDTYGTFEEVKGGTLLVGYAENPPWVIASERELAGIEVELIKGFAKSINAEIEWVNKNQHLLLEELEHRNLHFVISGLTKSTPWTSRVSVTGSFLEYQGQKHVIAVPPGEHRLLFELEDFLNEEEGAIPELLNHYTGIEWYNLED
ncbi:transporter substrate-binding domain-containing protein [Salegentibacter sp. F188]|jgi:ABC-type amino acid transport substrate-binding protein|uniref:Transporter substrate-binding domain-containing protein n=1 Tax=Autumnicola patrickiae TaxID=3075591 RepID=A0ABU3E6U0_9FLAO|nr:transporter substrate-binding domain-containing protein [Salegentibacter sp. F188]MDT0691645.1 transporter substrate-binding domain-containing protein [Salegentibacter sp. F188]